MNNVKINCGAVEAIVMAQELRNLGYKQGVDFDFAYHKSAWDAPIFTPSYTIYTFYNEQLASWFTLRYL